MERLSTTRPVFIGGTGRSGTTVTGRLIGAHPDIWLTDPIELKFISEPAGLANAVDWALRPSPRRTVRWRLGAIRRGRSPFSHPTPSKNFVSPDMVVAKMRGWWFDRLDAAGKPQGLARTMTMDQVTEATDLYLATFGADPIDASRTLVATLVEPLARANGLTRWVDTTPSSAPQAAKLARIFPDLQVIHTMRDGRDVIASVVKTQAWGPGDHLLALAWWEAGMRKAHAGMKSLPEGQAMVVQMEDLVVRDRDATFERLFAFLGLPVTPELRAHFATNVAQEKFNQGRYRSEVAKDQLTEFEVEYERVLARLDADNVPRPV